jgi:hypothetical protein
MYAYTYTNNINPYMIAAQTKQLNPSIDLTFINNKIKEALDQYTSQKEASKTLPNIDEMKQIIKKIVKENINELFPPDTDPLNVKQQCKDINQQLMAEFNQLKSLVETYQQNQDKLIAQFNTVVSERETKLTSNINSLLANKAGLNDLRATEQNMATQNNTLIQQLRNLTNTVAMKTSLDQVMPLVTEVNNHITQTQNNVEQNMAIQNNTLQQLRNLTDTVALKANLDQVMPLVAEVNNHVAQTQNTIEQNTNRKIKEVVDHISDNNNTFTSNITTINSILANKANKVDLRETNQLLAQKANKSDLDYIKLKINNINKRIQKNEQLVAKKFKKHLQKLRAVNNTFTSINSDIQNLNNGHQELVNNSLIMGTLFKQLYVEVSGYQATINTQLQELEESLKRNTNSLTKNNQTIQQLTNLISTKDQIIQRNFDQINQEIHTMKVKNQVSSTEIDKLQVNIVAIKRAYDNEQTSIKKRIDDLENDKDEFLDAIDYTKEQIQELIKLTQMQLDSINQSISEIKSDNSTDLDKISANKELISSKEQVRILLITELSELSEKLRYLG